MEILPRQQHHNYQQQQQSLLLSPNSHTSSSSSSSSSQTPTPPIPSPKPIQTRSDPNSPYPTTFVQADSASFKQVVQMLTGSPKPTTLQTDSSPPPTRSTTHYTIPPIKSIPKKTQASSGFKLYERRSSLKNLKINPLINPMFSQPGSGFSPRKPEILSPSVLDFPSLVLSPVTPLISDPFDRSSSGSPAFVNNNAINAINGSFLNKEAEEKAIKEKEFYFHPSPATTPREAAAEPPRLLPLFPVTSPRVSGSANPSSS